MESLDHQDFQWFFKDVTMRAGTLPDHADHNFKTFSLSCTEEAPSERLDFPPSNHLSLRDYFALHIFKTPAQCKEEREFPQRSAEWKLARKYALTASDFGAACGTNPYETGETLVDRKLNTPFQGNAATKWGCAMEPCADAAFLQYAKTMLGADAELHHPNLVKFSATSWLAVSPDAVVSYTKNGRKQYDLVEYKCPTQEPRGTHPYKRYEGCIPPYYASQMLGIWGYCNTNGGIPLVIDGTEIQVKLEKVWFVVWQPSDLWVSPFVPTSEDYDHLFLKLRKWYFELFLPALYRHVSGQSQARIVDRG
jgi:putative phage-type endonuclease